MFELPAQKRDVFLLAGQKPPTGLRVVTLGIFGEHLGGVVLGIDRDRVHEDVFANPLSQKPLHLRQARRLQRTGVRADGVDEIDRHDLVLDEIVEEMDGLTFVGDERDVRKVITIPRIAREHRRARREK